MANQHAKNIIASNKKILISYTIGFVVVCFLSILTKVLVNYRNKEEEIFPDLSEAFLWNGALFVILMLRAYFTSKPRLDQSKGKKVYIPGKELYKSTIIDIVILCTIVQFMTLFTLKCFYLYVLIPIYAVYALIQKIRNFM